MSPLSFGLIRDIRPEHPETWKDKVFLTFDMEWASDDVIENLVSILEKHHVSATWFVTHDTPWLRLLRKNPGFELGLHPNFNKLFFDGDFSNGKTPDEIVGRLKEWVPEAVSVRSHSLTQSAGLTKVFQKFGLTHESNQFIPCHTAMDIKPWYDWCNMVSVPFYWSDADYLIHLPPDKVETLMENPGLKVFNFHPIHVAINSTTYDAYEYGKGKQWEGKLQDYFCTGVGMKVLLEDIIVQVCGDNVHDKSVSGHSILSCP